MTRRYSTQLMRSRVERMMLPTWLRVPVAAVLVTAITWALVALTKRICPRSRRLLG